MIIEEPDICTATVLSEHDFTPGPYVSVALWVNPQGNGPSRAVYLKVPVEHLAIVGRMLTKIGAHLEQIAEGQVDAANNVRGVTGRYPPLTIKRIGEEAA